MATTPPPDLPIWAWNLIIAIQTYEEQHSSSHTCLQRVLTAVPEDVRSQADGISAYIRQASGNALADKAAKTWGDLIESLFSTGKSDPGQTNNPQN